MKKTYIIPSIKVKKVAGTESILAASGLEESSDGKWTQSWGEEDQPSTITDKNSVLGKSRSIWDEEY